MEKEKSNTKSVILIIVIILLLVIIGLLVWMVLHPKETVVIQEVPQETEESQPTEGIAYDSAAVAVDEESFEKALKEMMADEGTMALDMKANAYSKDGLNFSCSLANSPRNKYNMYMILYLDETGEELYRSGLIPLGKKIDRFTINRELGKGRHECTIVYTQVEDDNATTHASANVGLDLVVE